MRALIPLFSLILLAGSPALAQDAPEATTEEVALPAAVPEPAPDAAVLARPVEETADVSESVAEEDTEIDVVDTLNTTLEAGKSGDWALMIGGILLLVVWVIRSFLWGVFPSKYIPGITVGVATAAAFGAAIFAGAEVPAAVMAAISGLFGGLGAAGVLKADKSEGA